MLDLSSWQAVLILGGILLMALAFYCKGYSKGAETRSSPCDYVEAFNNGFDAGKLQGYWEGYTACLKYTKEDQRLTPDFREYFNGKEVTCQKETPPNA